MSAEVSAPEQRLAEHHRSTEAQIAARIEAIKPLWIDGARYADMARAIGVSPSNFSETYKPRLLAWIEESAIEIETEYARQIYQLINIRNESYAARDLKSYFAAEQRLSSLLGFERRRAPRVSL